MSSTWVRVAVLSTCFSFIIFPCTGQNRTVTEQRVFTSEDESVDRPVALSGPAVQAICRSLGDNPCAIKSDNMVSASAIHLRANGEGAFVVVGTHVLRGPHNAQFWVVEGDTRGYRVILSAVGDRFTVLGSRYHGYSVIRVENLLTMNGEVSAKTYRFESGSYKQAQTTDVQ